MCESPFVCAILRLFADDGDDDDDDVCDDKGATVVVCLFVCFFILCLFWVPGLTLVTVFLLLFSPYI